MLLVPGEIEREFVIASSPNSSPRFSRACGGESDAQANLRLRAETRRETAACDTLPVCLKDKRDLGRGVSLPAPTPRTGSSAVCRVNDGG